MKIEQSNIARRHLKPVPNINLEKNQNSCLEAFFVIAHVRKKVKYLRINDIQCCANWWTYKELPSPLSSLLLVYGMEFLHYKWWISHGDNDVIVDIG